MTRMKEIEVKILNVNVDKIIDILSNLGASKRGIFNYTRIIFAKPYQAFPLREWIRLRTDDEITTLAYKKIENKNIGGTTEIEVAVDNFDKTAMLLKKIGLRQLLLQESRRIAYSFNDIEFDIDFWPGLNPYLEIEAQSREKLEEGMALLGFTPDKATTKTAEELFRDVGININNIKELRFTDQNSLKYQFHKE
jgi:adenylate cyclase class 2